MGIFYEADETEADEEYEAWFKQTLKELYEFHENSRKTILHVGVIPINYEELRSKIKCQNTQRRRERRVKGNKY